MSIYFAVLFNGLLVCNRHEGQYVGNTQKINDKNVTKKLGTLFEKKKKIETLSAIKN